MYVYVIISVSPSEHVESLILLRFFSEMKHYNGDGNKNMMHGLKLNDVARNRKDYDWFFY